MNIEPIENFVLAGFLKRYQSVFFHCPVIWASSNDKLLALKRAVGNSELTYPYAFLTLDSIAYDSDAGLNNSSLGRRGIAITVNEGETLSQRVRLMSAVFNINCQFTTNSHMQAIEYTKLWMFAYRFGHLKFNIKYGRLKNIRCNVILADSASIPIREDKTENESVYTIETTAEIHGYVSKSLIETKPMLHDLRVVPSTKLQGAAVSIWKQTWTIPNKANS